MVALLLALADSGIPVQTDVVPEPLLKKLQPGKISGFLCLGNVGSSVVRSLKRIATDMRFVAGDAEEEAHLPLAQVCTYLLLQNCLSVVMSDILVSKPFLL